MRTKFNHYGLWAAAVFLLVGLSFGVTDQRPVAAFWPAQNGEPIIVTEKGCDFDFDYDGDGEPNGSFDPAGDGYLLQDTPVIGHCFFQVSVIVDATIIVESELADWDADAEIERVAKQYAETKSLNSGRSEIAVSDGGHRVNIWLRGKTPRGSAHNALPEKYRHDIQVPRHFKLVNITVTTDAGDKEWVVSHDAESASNAYIEAYDAVNEVTNDPDSALPASVLALSQQLLSEGYPEIAVRVIALEVSADSNGGGDSDGTFLPVWAWVAVAAGLVLIVVAAVLWWMWMRRSPSLPDDD